jgi:hypothetical protein
VQDYAQGGEKCKGFLVDDTLAHFLKGVYLRFVAFLVSYLPETSSPHCCGRAAVVDLGVEPATDYMWIARAHYQAMQTNPIRCPTAFEDDARIHYIIPTPEFNTEYTRLC